MARDAARNVGCSEVAALFGIHEYITGFALAARKLGKLSDQLDDAVLRRGRLLEPVAKQLIAEENPDWQVDRGQHLLQRRLNSFRLHAGPSSRTNAGQVSYKSRPWRRRSLPASGATPMATSSRRCGSRSRRCASSIDRRRLRLCRGACVGYGISLEMVEVPYLPHLIESARERVFLFNEMISEGKLPPPDYGEDGKHIARVYTEDDGTELDLTADNRLPEVVQQYEALTAAKKTAEEGIEEAKAEILHRLGNAQRARFAGGVISRKIVSRKEYLVAAGSYPRMTIRHDRKREEDAA